MIYDKADWYEEGHKDGFRHGKEHTLIMMLNMLNDCTEFGDVVDLRFYLKEKIQKGDSK